jgi:hypothetical protein
VTMKLELKPEIEAGLMAQAQARGLSLEDYLDQVLQSAADIFVKQGDSWAVKGIHIERVKDSAERAEIPAQKRPAGRKSLAQLFAESPFKGLDLRFERDPDTGRPVKL